MKILSFDIGDKVIGVAISDLTEMIVTPKMPLIYEKKKSLIDLLVAQVINEKVKKVVVGYPLNMDGTKGKQANKVINIVASLKKKLPNIEWVLHDERLSSWSVRRKYSTLKLSKKKQIKNIDSFSAMEILNDFLRIPPKEF